VKYFHVSPPHPNISKYYFVAIIIKIFPVKIAKCKKTRYKYGFYTVFFTANAVLIHLRYELQAALKELISSDSISKDNFFLETDILTSVLGILLLTSGFKDSNTIFASSSESNTNSKDAFFIKTIKGFFYFDFIRLATVGLSL